MPSSRLGCPLSLKTPNMGNTGSNVNPFIADWAETDNVEQIPGAKLALGALEIGAFQQTDIDGIPNGGEQRFDYEGGNPKLTRRSLL